MNAAIQAGTIFPMAMFKIPLDDNVVGGAIQNIQFIHLEPQPRPLIENRAGQVISNLAFGAWPEFVNYLVRDVQRSWRKPIQNLASCASTGLEI